MEFLFVYLKFYSRCRAISDMPESQTFQSGRPLAFEVSLSSIGRHCRCNMIPFISFIISLWTSASQNRRTFRWNLLTHLHPLCGIRVVRHLPGAAPRSLAVLSIDLRQPATPISRSCSPGARPPSHILTSVPPPLGPPPAARRQASEQCRHCCQLFDATVM